VDPQLAALARRLDELSAQVEELREGIRQSVTIAAQDPEMSLTRARKVLEYMLREVYERRVGEPAGTRPLENLAQRLVRDGHLPKRLAAYANAIRELGNVGTHAFGEKVTPQDVFQSLTQLVPLVEWYFQQRGPAPPAGAPAAPVSPAPTPVSALPLTDPTRSAPDAPSPGPAVVSPLALNSIRQLRLLKGVRQLLDCHRALAKIKQGRDWGKADSTWVFLGGWLTFLMIFNLLVIALGPNEDKWGGVLVLGVIGVPGLGALLYGLWTVVAPELRRIKARRRPQHDLAAKIKGLLSEFPQECQAWGGPPALRDQEIAEEVLRALEAAKPPSPA
jgi:hypothetical protein